MSMMSGQTEVTEPVVVEVKVNSQASDPFGGRMVLPEPQNVSSTTSLRRLQSRRAGDGAQDITDRALLLAEIIELAGQLRFAGRARHPGQLRCGRSQWLRARSEH